MINIPILQTERLTIRPFEVADLDKLDQIYPRETDLTARDFRRERMEWVISATSRFAKYGIPSYLDRAVVLRASDTLIGAVGYNAEIEPFESLPYLGGNAKAFSTPEISLYWEIGEAYRRKGYATEAAQALVDYAFKVARVKRLIALTHPTNLGSLGVMRKLGMYIETAQGACGILENKLEG